MKITQIDIEDFRSFYGKQSINISTNDETNVTLILAQNGSGKTNLLNSIRMCFHNVPSENFREKKEIINHQALKEGRQEAKIGITFINDGAEYIAERKWLNSKMQKSEFGEEFKINKIEKGNFIPQKAPNDIIAKIFPASMAGNFAFDGEGAVRMTSREQSKKLQASTKDILGTHYVDYALKDLGTLNRLIKKQLSESETEGEQKSILKHYEQLEKEIEDCKKEIADLETSQNSERIQLDDINKSLIGVTETAPLIKDQETNRALLEKKESENNDLKKEKMQWLNNNGRAILSERLADLTDEIMESAKASGKIPYEYSQPFIEKILDKKVCICGREFKNHSDEERKILRMTESAGSVRVNEEIKEASNVLYNLRRNSISAKEKFANIERREKSLNTEISSIEGFLKEIDIKLDNVPKVENVTDKIEKKKILEHKRDSNLRKEGALKKSLEELEQKKLDVNKKIDALLSRNPKNNKLRAKIKLIEDSIAKIKQILKDETEDARTIIEEKINIILSKTLRKNFRCKIHIDFNLEYYDSFTNDMIIPSDGETVVVTLAYVSALIEFCKERMSNDNPYLINGINSPLILDAPFSSLDNMYIERVVDWVPKMNNQVILMLNIKDFKSVEKSIENKVGSLWVGKIYSSKEDKKMEEINSIFGKEAIFRAKSTSHTYTQFYNIDL